MILLFALESDYSAKKVMEWLKFWGVKFANVCRNEIAIKKITTENEDLKIELIINGKDYLYSDIVAVWYKSNYMRIKNRYTHKQDFAKDTLDWDISLYLDGHFNTQENFIEYLFSKVRTLGGNRLGSANKLITLLEAKNVGLDVPKFSMCNEKELLNTNVFHKNSIVKSIDVTFGSKVENHSIMAYTTDFSKDMIRSEGSSPLHTFVQEKIEKAYEIRSFYIKGHFFSTAIMSQTNPFTRTDLRKYHLGPSNRALPYSLPNNIEKMLDLLCKKLNFDTGSFDIIRGRDGKYYLLEINPVGQYGTYSKHCNYNLHKVIAKYLAYGTF